MITTSEKIQLDSDEHVLIEVRKHWIVLFSQIISVLFVANAPILFVYALTYFGDIYTLPLSQLFSTALFFEFYAAWLLFSWMTLFSIWTNYYLDVWTITNKRLIAVDQRGLFYRNTGSFRLERLQDINISIKGIVATFLDYGDLTAETASEDRDFVARSIPHPQELKALILSAADNITFTSPERPMTAAAPQSVNDGL